MAMREVLPSLWGRPERYPATFNSFRKQVARMFDDFNENLRLPDRLEPAGKLELAPEMDVVENDKEIRLSLELPGVDEKDIDISVAGHTITISGEKKLEAEDKSTSGFRRERSYGSFQRTLTLPFEINCDMVRAGDDKGVLTITIPKPTEAMQQARKIQIAGSKSNAQSNGRSVDQPGRRSPIGNQPSNMDNEGGMGKEGGRHNGGEQPDGERSTGGQFTGP